MFPKKTRKIQNTIPGADPATHVSANPPQKHKPVRRTSTKYQSPNHARATQIRTPINSRSDKKTTTVLQSRQLPDSYFNHSINQSINPSSNRAIRPSHRHKKTTHRNDLLKKANKRTHASNNSSTRASRVANFRSDHLAQLPATTAVDSPYHM